MQDPRYILADIQKSDSDDYRDEEISDLPLIMIECEWLIHRSINWRIG